MNETDVIQKKLLKALEQGQQIENLVAAPEWEFFEGWVTSVKEGIVRDITSNVYINDHNGYLKAIAQYQAFDEVLNGVAKFRKAFKAAANRLNELESIDE